MSDRTYPFGYGLTRLTFAEMMTRITVAKLHPEFRRRFFCAMEVAAEEGVDIGIGTGWRIQPVGKPGFASPGNSHHEGMPDTYGIAYAIDMVPSTSNAWMRNNCHRFGLRTFHDVNNEPWHDQPFDIPAGRNWRTEPYYLAEFQLPTDPVIPTPPVGPTNPEPELRTSVITFERVTLDWHGRAGDQALRHPDVKCFQRIANKFTRDGTNQLTEDGIYGLHTISAVMDIQKFFSLEPDGVCGPKTWGVLYNVIMR